MRDRPDGLPEDLAALLGQHEPYLLVAWGRCERAFQACRTDAASVDEASLNTMRETVRAVWSISKPWLSGKRFFVPLTTERHAMVVPGSGEERVLDVRDQRSRDALGFKRHETQEEQDVELKALGLVKWLATAGWFMYKLAAPEQAEADKRDFLPKKLIKGVDQRNFLRINNILYPSSCALSALGMDYDRALRIRRSKYFRAQLSKVAARTTYVHQGYLGAWEEDVPPVTVSVDTVKGIGPVRAMKRQRAEREAGEHGGAREASHLITAGLDPCVALSFHHNQRPQRTLLTHLDSDAKRAGWMDRFLVGVKQELFQDREGAGSQGEDVKVQLAFIAKPGQLLSALLPFELVRDASKGVGGGGSGGMGGDSSKELTEGTQLMRVVLDALVGDEALAKAQIELTLVQEAFSVHVNHRSGELTVFFTSFENTEARCPPEFGTLRMFQVLPTEHDVPDAMTFDEFCHPGGRAARAGRPAALAVPASPPEGARGAAAGGGGGGEDAAAEDAAAADAGPPKRMGH